MCLEPDRSFWINLFLWVFSLAHEHHEVQVQISKYWYQPCSLPTPCNQLLHSWLIEASPFQCQVSHYGSRQFQFFKLRDPLLFVWLIFLCGSQTACGVCVCVFGRGRFCDVTCEIQWLCYKNKNCEVIYYRLDTMCIGLRCWHLTGRSRDSDLLKSRPWDKKCWAPLL